MAWSVAFREQVACNNSGIVLRLEFKAVLCVTVNSAPDVRFGSKQTLKRFQPMAALFPKADMDHNCWDVRLVPKADMPQIEALEPDRSKK
jgi:hypothetical protein